MEQIEALKKKLKCQNCHKPYSSTRSAYISKSCNHHVCLRCVVNSKCPKCDKSTLYTCVPFLKDMLNTLKGYEALQNENSILKQEKRLLGISPDHYKCIECDELYSEKDMQLCGTCHELKFDDPEDVKKYALCAGCAIRKHMRKGHQTADFFPCFSAYNFLSQSSEVKSNSEEFKSAQNSLNDTLTRFNALSNKVSGNYDSLIDMARRSKNTTQQVECFEKMKTFIDKSKSIHGEADSDMKNHTKKLEETFAEIKEWYKSRMGDCVDESEVVKLLSSDKNNNEINA